jgi:hypothetical protein
LDFIKNKNMNKKILILTLVGLVFGGMTVFAATTVSLSPVNVNINEGQNFNLAVSVNPQGVKNYTVKLEIKYPADILEVKSFSFGNNWMPLSQTGYDLLDNSNGTLIKTAGYPGGLDSNASFGTVVFSAKKSGNVEIQVAGDSLALDASNQNVISGLPVKTSVVVASVARVETEEQEEIIPQKTPSSQEQVVAPEPGEQEELTEELVVDAPNAFLAMASSIITLGTGSNVLGIIVLFLIFLVAYIAYSRFVKKK